MALAILIVIAIVLRIPHLTGSFWLDEAAQALESSRPFTQQLLIRGDFQPPLIHYLTHFSLYFSDSEWWLRTIAALIPGLITIGVFYKITNLWFSKKVAIWSTLLLTTSSFHIFFSQELRPYSLPAMFALLSWYFLNKENNFKNLAIFTLATIGGLYSSYLYPLVLITQGLWTIIFRKKTWQKFLTTAILSALAFLPWMPSFLDQLSAGGDVREQLPGWDQVVSLTQGKAIFLTLGKFLFGLDKIDLTPLVFLSLLSLLLIGLCLGKDLYLEIKKENNHFTKVKNKYLQVLLIFFTPLLLAWLISFAVPVLSPKRVLYLLPFFYLLIVAPLDFLPKKTAPVLLILTVFFINIFTTTHYYFDKNLQREDWRTLHTQIIKRFEDKNAIAVFSHPEAFSPWRWYDGTDFPSLATGTLSVSQVPDLSEKFKVINDYQYVLVFDYLRTLSDPENKIMETVSSFGFKEIEVIDTPNIGFVRIYARPEAVLSSLDQEF